MKDLQLHEIIILILVTYFFVIRDFSRYIKQAAKWTYLLGQDARLEYEILCEQYFNSSRDY